MKIIGITGGIGSGKSIVSKLFSIHGIPVYDTDSAAKRLNDTSLVIRKCLIEKFGDDLYTKGTLNRLLLASLIFQNFENLQFVNSVVHPEVDKDFLEWKSQQTAEIIAIESAILFESKLNRMVDFTVSISTPLKIKIERIEKQKQWKRKEIIARINNQMSDNERNRLSDFIIINDNSHSLLLQIEKLLKTII